MIENQVLFHNSKRFFPKLLTRLHWISKLSWGEKVPLNYHGVYRLVVSKLSWGFTFCSFLIKNLSL